MDYSTEGRLCYWTIRLYSLDNRDPLERFFIRGVVGSEGTF